MEQKKITINLDNMPKHKNQEPDPWEEWGLCDRALPEAKRMPLPKEAALRLEKQKQAALKKKGKEE
ncbi:MAG: hypothetical protein PUF74_08540 [Sodaliphilus pleomorphus]|uniref:hypothetical protein n=1 Tax=Sodaliphilus pleomorphus TaxID=2606626 RepID=UPI00240A7E24|nr:hypothetical protein [Sodaliphilus pleomorphus]MDD6475551.1 hypothetical protein [Sodaliphilus pleomorphus]